MALYLLKELDNNAKVAVWQITETEEELRALSSTPSDEMEEISFIKSESLPSTSSSKTKYTSHTTTTASRT